MQKIKEFGIKQLIRKFETNPTSVTEEELLSVFLNDTKLVGIIMPTRPFETIVPMMGIGIKSGNAETTDVVFGLDENGRYKKGDWHYKVSLKPIAENEVFQYGCEHPYLCDLLSHLRQGHSKLINIETYEKEIENEKR